jgi:hypothetical protein
MAAIRESVEIARRPEVVFAYLDDLARHGEWQEQIVRVDRVEPQGPTQVGTRATETRKMGGREQTMTYEITERNPPWSFAFRGVDGPVRPRGRGTIESLDDGARTRLTIEFDFEGHGLGKLLRPLAVRGARNEIPKNQRKLKELLESDAA